MIEPIARDLAFWIPDGVARTVKILPAITVAGWLEFVRVERGSISRKRDKRGGEMIARNQILFQCDVQCAREDAIVTATARRPIGESCVDGQSHLILGDPIIA